MFRLFTVAVAVAIALSAGIAIADGLPAYILELPDSVDSVLIAETDTSTLHRYRHTAGGLVSVDKRYMSVGQNGVGKKRAWDRRTPLGIYFVSEQLDTIGLHERYGPTAFPLDYPNVWDQLNRRAGDGIWIHGVAPNGGRRPPLDTDGCIALPNDELMALEEHLVPMVTPVVIARRIAAANPEQIAAVRNVLSAALETWVQSYRDGDWHRYLSLYAADFEYRDLDRNEWLAYRLQAVATRPIRGFNIDDVMLLADPDEDGLFLSRFRQTIIEDDRKVVTRKRLYWRQSEDGALRIVAEDNG